MMPPNAPAISVPVPDSRTPTHEFRGYTVVWIHTNWFQILIAAGVAAASVAALYALRGLGCKLCNPDRPTGSWISIIGKAVSKTTGFFIVMVAVRLVDGYARTPPMLDQLVVFLFPVAAVFPGAI